MDNWTEMERGAMASFLGTQGPLKSALEKFIQSQADSERALCTINMATVPRNIEAAADHAAKAQLLDEFWTLLEDAVIGEQMSPVSTQVS